MYDGRATKNYEGWEKWKVNESNIDQLFIFSLSTPNDLLNVFKHEAYFFRWELLQTLGLILNKS
jgi:hypothetical protein